MYLLKNNHFDLVLKLMKKKEWNVNHQNDDGNTFGHILAYDDSLMAVKVAEQLTKKKNYIPNVKNKKGETAFDRALNNHHLCTTFKILEDKIAATYMLENTSSKKTIVLKNSYFEE